MCVRVSVFACCSRFVIDVHKSQKESEKKREEEQERESEGDRANKVYEQSDIWFFNDFNSIRNVCGNISLSN